MLSIHLVNDKLKKLFLSIALFLVGMEKNYTLKILQGSNLFLKNELGVLGC
jgi:hypothetical protein